MVWSHPREQTETGNYRPEPGTLLFLLLLLRYQLIQNITLYAPEEAGCGFEYEQRLYCRVLDMFQKVCECPAG